MIEELKKIQDLKAAWDTTKEECVVANAKRDAISKKLKEVRIAIDQCHRDFTKCATDVDFELDFSVNLVVDLGELKEQEKELNEQYKEANKNHKPTWQKLEKIENKIKKLQKKYWISLGLSVLPEWEQKANAD